MGRVRTRVLEGFDDPTFGSAEWHRLLDRHNTDIIYLTWHYQRAWWETFQRGQLLLIVAERDGEAVALAPLHTQSGMVYFLGTEFESDYLDFIGDISDPEVLDALLVTARDRVPGFAGFELYFVADSSQTGKRLVEAADRLGLGLDEEYEMRAPVLDLTRREIALAAANKPKLVKLERAFQRDGRLEVRHLRNGEEILPHLEPFIEQHIARWEGTPHRSRFLYDKVRVLVERFTRAAAHTGWLRFTRIDWNGRAIAFHYGFCYRGRYFWGMPSFAIDLARRSPGQLLLRHVLLAAVEEGARSLDFGTGDQPFKLRFANRVEPVRTWSLYQRGPRRETINDGGGEASPPS